VKSSGHISFSKIFRQAVAITLFSSLVGLMANLIHPNKISYISLEKYQILVPCPEPGGEVFSLSATEFRLYNGNVYIVDARQEAEYLEWKYEKAINVPFDYLDPTSPEVIEQLTTEIVNTKAKRVVVYGDGQEPDSGELLAKEISSYGIKNVFFVKGGAPVIKNKVDNYRGAKTK
jgi:rhodanese-related sulfurtransferase